MISLNDNNNFLYINNIKCYYKYLLGFLNIKRVSNKEKNLL